MIVARNLQHMFLKLPHTESIHLATVQSILAMKKFSYRFEFTGPTELSSEFSDYIKGHRSIHRVCIL